MPRIFKSVIPEPPGIDNNRKIVRRIRFRQFLRLSRIALLGLSLAAALDAQQRQAVPQKEIDEQYELGMRQLLENHLPEAESTFRYLRELEPARLRWMPGMVEVLVKQKKQDEAVQLVKSQAEKLPDSREPRLWFADAAETAGLRELAQATYKKVLDSLDPGSADTADVYLRLGRNLARQQDWQAARDLLGKAKALQPDNPSVLLAFALAMDRNAPPAEIERAYRDVLRVQSNNWVAMNNLAFVLARGKDIDTALVYARRAKMAAPEVPEVIDTLGFVYTAKRLTNLAISTLAEAVRKSPENLQFRGHLADALAQRNDDSAAMKSLQAALRDGATPADKVVELIKDVK